MDVSKNTVSGKKLLSYVERLERIRADKKNLSADEALVIAEAKAEGFVASAIRYCLKVRAMKPTDRQENEAMADMYLNALGMATDTPLFRAVDLMQVDVTSREQVIDAMKKFVPATGSITVETPGGLPVKMTRDKAGNVHVEEVEKRWSESKPDADKPAAKPERPVPGVDLAGAEQLGREAFENDEPIIANPFPFGDERRACWDKGWRDASGGDGMDD